MIEAGERSLLFFLRPLLLSPVLLAIAILLQSAAPSAAESVTKTWAMAEFGEPLYKDGFEHWPYANPDAPKGGKIVLSAFGTYDTFNPITLKGQTAAGWGITSDALMANSGDELASAYGVIAENVDFPDDRSWIVFNLRPEARFHDGEAITAEDFVYTFTSIREHGAPFLKSHFADVETVEALTAHRVKFSFKTRDSMKPLMKVALLWPTPKHYWETRDISKTTLEPPLGNGPYRVKSFEAGRSVTYKRVPDYWAADLKVSRGLNNFDEIRYDYYRDPEVLFEAFKAGGIDFRAENSSKRWSTGYDIKPVKDGHMTTRTVPDNSPSGIQAYFFNLRRPQFQDQRAREAIGHLYDFEALRKKILYNQYSRIKSFFPNSDFGSSGPPQPEEIAVLEPYRDQLPEEVFAKAFEPPKTDGSGKIRKNLRKALSLFKQAGWVLKGGKLVDAKTGKQMKIEFLIVQADSKRTVLPFVDNLKRAGIDASVRLIDTSQYTVRLDDFDFDMTTVFLNFFPPPGAELRSYYGSAAADVRGSANMAGIKHPVVDALIEQIIEAKDLETLKATSRALDRVMLWQHYVIPQFFNDQHRLAYWNRFGYPDRPPEYGVGFINTWWIDPERDAALER